MDAVMKGIREFSHSRVHWKIGVVYVQDVEKGWIQDLVNWKPDGLLLAAKPSSVQPLLKALRIPTVVIDVHHEHPRGLSRIETDEVAVGRLAAAFLLEKRFENFGVVTTPNNPPRSQLRSLGFTDTLKKKRLNVESFQLRHLRERPWYRNPDLETWLRELPKPVGIYCVSDSAVLRLLEHCDTQNLRVPTEVSLLGTMNNIVECTSMKPEITSISLPYVRSGFQAGQMLEDAIKRAAKGADPVVRHEKVQPDGVVERQSTSLRAIPDPAVAKAVNYLYDHVLEGATVPEAVKVAGVARRTLEMGFKTHLGVTPNQFIGEIKISHAKTLLIETDLRMWEIAECCRLSPEYFNRLFRKFTGQTPNDYRKAKSHRMNLSST